MVLTGSVARRACGLGLSPGSSELRMFSWPVITLGSDDRLSDFNAWFAGFRNAIGL